MRAVQLNRDGIRDIAPDVLGPDGRLRILPASYWATTTPVERAMFGHDHGIYAFPTQELVDWLRDVIGRRKAIEIGCGNGVLADALGIVGTDSYQQAMPNYAAIYAAARQPTVTYGPNVVRSAAHRAIRRYRPQVVIGCWVTHLYDRNRPRAGGNEVGIDEADVLANCQLYIHVGHQGVHGGKAINARWHDRYYPDWLYSRSTGHDFGHSGGLDYIATWRGGRN